MFVYKLQIKWKFFYVCQSVSWHTALLIFGKFLVLNDILNSLLFLLHLVSFGGQLLKPLVFFILNILHTLGHFKKFGTTNSLPLNPPPSTPYPCGRFHPFVKRPLYHLLIYIRTYLKQILSVAILYFLISLTPTSETFGLAIHPS